jgi:hypothetical protein
MQSDELQEEQQQQQQKTNDIKPVLLSKTELHWLLGDIKVSKSFEYKIISSIRRKTQTLAELELPLLVKNNFFSDYYYHYDGIDDDSLGRDLEPGLSLHHLSNDTALVRQRSRVQIPAKALLFCKKEEESGFFPVVSVLRLAVTVLQLHVTSVFWWINPFSISNGSSSSCRVRIFFLISLFIFR